MESLLSDLRYAFREITRRPGFTVLAILTLATGIGAATTMYSVIHNVLLNPFPYTDPRRMVDVIAHNLENQRQIGPLTIPEFRAFVDESNIFEEAVGTNTTPTANAPRNAVRNCAVLLSVRRGQTRLWLPTTVNRRCCADQRSK
jgi:hypothetical protein